MKREILFKAVKADGSGWIEGNYVQYKGHLECFVSAIQVLNSKKEVLSVETIIPETLCQFIDDFKCKRFFDCDIAVHPDLGKGVIKYANTGYVIVYSDGYTIDLHEDWNELKIIGNIHDKHVKP